ncbi:MAG TPA: T9SS type A sorting domain-containing protein, partial [Ignavibacteriales bacterium]|nr:T9SS type A sorting domain-containing protein [Ignavibacteriales bacterium]
NQNYPNPFNPSTIISYEIPAEKFVTLKVYDALGKEVKTLVSGTQNAGKHKISLDASGLSSGVYFYQLKAGDYSCVKKFVKLK